MTYSALPSYSTSRQLLTGKRNSHCRLTLASGFGQHLCGGGSGKQKAMEWQIHDYLNKYSNEYKRETDENVRLTFSPLSGFVVIRFSNLEIAE